MGRHLHNANGINNRRVPTTVRNIKSQGGKHRKLERRNILAIMTLSAAIGASVIGYIQYFM